jgi:hypothetical protein
MKKNYEKYVKTQEEVAAKKKSTESQIYTITD